MNTKIEVEVTRKDYGEYNLYYILHKGFLLKRKWILFLIIIVMSISRIVNDEINIENIVKNILITLFTNTAFLGVFVFIFIKLVERLPSNNGTIIGKRTYIFTDDEFIEESIANTNHLKWTGVISVEENQNLIMIFIDNTTAYILPKRYFKSLEEQTIITDFIKTMINKPNQRLSSNQMD